MEGSVEKIFDEWISFYEAEDSFVPKLSSDKVYRRKFIGPIMRIEDYRALGYDKVLDRYNESIKGSNNIVVAMFDTINNLAYYIDGKRTLSQVTKELSLSSGNDESEAVELLIDTYLGLDLIEEVTL